MRPRKKKLYHFMSKIFNILSIDCDWVRSLKHQEDLLSFLIPILTDGKEIHLAYDHDKIYPLFPHGYEEYNLINVDHHHDYIYKEFQKALLNEECWLFHLSTIFKKKINYTWINNFDSEHLGSAYARFAKERLKSYTFDHNISFIKPQTFDKIFICCSPPSDYNTPEGITTYKIIEGIVNGR